MKKSKLVQVRPSDFNVTLLKQAMYEGRLFIATLQTSKEEIREKGIRQILQYVSRIDVCASPECRTFIHLLWDTLLRSPELGDLFFFSRYSQNRGLPNFYRVNAICFILLEMGIYRRDFTAVDLHLRLEQTQKRNTHYTGSSKYYPEHKEIVKIKAILKELYAKKEE